MQNLCSCLLRRTQIRITFFRVSEILFIHIFRMPIFFVMAGFFAAMLYLRRGPGGLAQNRATRIVVPFATSFTTRVR